MNTYNHKLRYHSLWLSVGVALVAVVVLMSLWPSPPQTTLKFSDKVGHFLAYFVLMAWFGQIYRTRRVRLAWLVGLCAIGLALELIQGTMPTRSADVADALANATGALAGWLVTLGAGGRIVAAVERRLGPKDGIGSA
jgi:VanZ family protein